MLERWRFQLRCAGVVIIRLWLYDVVWCGVGVMCYLGRYLGM